MVHRIFFIVSLLCSVALAQLPFQTASCAWNYCASQLCSDVPDFGECSCYNQSGLVYACIADSCGDAFIDSALDNQVSAFNACCGITCNSTSLLTYSCLDECCRSHRNLLHHPLAKPLPFHPRSDNSSSHRPSCMSSTSRRSCSDFFSNCN